MTNEPWRPAIAAAHARQREIILEKLAQVRAAIKDLLDDPRLPPSSLNVHRISQRPDTPSHEFIAAHSGERARRSGYGHDLRAEIAQARREKEKRLQADRGDAHQQHDIARQGLHAQLGTYRSRLNAKSDELRQERESHAATKRQLQIALGAELDRGALIDPAQHQELRNQIERLQGQVISLGRELAEVKRGRRDAQEEALALRTAAQALADELNAEAGNVIHFRSTAPPV